MQKTLYILRHAKTETGLPGQDDRDRALIQRGAENARTMGEYLSRQHIRPEKILCSTAKRARQTWELLGLSIPVEYSDKLYLASANEMLNVIAETPENIQSLMIIGHNPGLHELAVKLAKSGDDQMLDALTLKFPTCTLAAIEIDSTWREVIKTKGQLQKLVVAKEWAPD